MSYRRRPSASPSSSHPPDSACQSHRINPAQKKVLPPPQTHPSQDQPVQYTNQFLFYTVKMQINGPNNASETQESWLAPSIPNLNHRPAFKLFFEPTPGGFPSQGAPSQTQSKELEQAQSLLNAPSPNEPLRPIHIDYMVYNRVAPTPLAGKKKGAAKGWEKVTPAKDIVWKTSITNWTWAQVKAQVIDLIHIPQKYLAAHITAQDSLGTLRWFCIILNHRTYGTKSNYSVTSDADFAPFAKAVTQSPRGKVIIKITMDDPDVESYTNLRAKAKAQDDNLAMNYGPDDKQRALELMKTRQAVNPKADVNAGDTSAFVADITVHINKWYGLDSKTMQIKDPKDPKKSIRIDRQNIWVWAHAMQHGAPGVDLDHPPETSQFQSENKAILTVDERKEKTHARAKIPTASLGNPANAKFSPTHLAPGGRTPQETPVWGPKIWFEPDHNQVEGSNSNEVKGCPFTDQAAGKTCSRKTSSASSDIKLVSGACQDTSIPRSPARNLARSPAGDGVSHTLSRLNFGRRHSPRRKSVSPVHKTPGSQGSSVYPANVICISPGTSIVVQEPPVTKPLRPLTEAGRALSIDSFLAHCNFAADNMIPRALIQLAHIRHWSYFREASLTELQKRDHFPLPIARQLNTGAAMLERTHTAQEFDIKVKTDDKDKMENSPEL
ncbi:hypothetical protein PCASD_13256 [Puccinia coronata f. sp. avenae]|uniref:Uncharacterized protein n=1 Tax=Puccinia coronata f. sp. avenae TaxID=200324 RepID=A0A2N5UGE9_9BASI|nr:hypothetical protein PCASD_13256 [Puccinia coronata f. sp. avenae]